MPGKTFLCFLVFLLGFQCCAQASEPALSAASAVLMEAATGQVLWEKDGYRPRPPASTTKIMTGLLASESGGLGATVHVSQRAGDTGQASIYLEAGDQVPLGELLQGMLICSGNDAAVAVAEQVGGSVEFFALQMNRKARLLGARTTHFVNPNGLPARDHVTSAYDLALMARYALGLPSFRQAVASKEAVLEGANGWRRVVRTTNRLLGAMPGADGVKTGTTNAAGQCLVASATRQGRQLIAVVLRSGDRFGEAWRLLEYGFQAYRLVELPAGSPLGFFPVPGGNPYRVQGRLAEGVLVSLPAKDWPALERQVWSNPVQAPLLAGASLGEFRLVLRGQVLATAGVVADRPVQRPGWWQKKKAG